jgi:hypothetical protein
MSGEKQRNLLICVGVVALSVFIVISVRAGIKSRRFSAIRKGKLIVKVHNPE